MIQSCRFEGLHMCADRAMLSKMLLLLATLIACISCVHGCGEEVLSQNFDAYAGSYEPWTKDMGKDDMPGLIFIKQESLPLISVGSSQFRAENPEGTAQACMHVTCCF